VVSYLLPAAAEGDLTLTFRDASGAEVRSFKSKPKDTPSAETPEATKDKPDDDEPKAPAKAGFNRFVWDLRGAPAQKISSGDGHKDVSLAAPRVPPGRYQVELAVAGRTLSAEFGVVPDPRADTTQAEYAAQYALLQRIHGLLNRVHAAVNQVRAIREQVQAWVTRTEKHAAGAQIAEAGKQLNARLAAAEERLLQVKAKSNQDTLNFPVMLNAKLSFLAMLAGGAETGPTRAHELLCEDLALRVEEQILIIEAALAEDLPAFNALVRASDVPAIVVPTAS
jgi:hypothetical protein